MDSIPSPETEDRDLLRARRWRDEERWREIPETVPERAPHVTLCVMDARAVREPRARSCA